MTTPWALVVQWAGIVLAAGALAGLLARRRAAHLVLLPVLLAVVVLSSGLPLLRPEFLTWEFWLWREFAHAGLLLLMGLELAVRLFFRVTPAQHVARLGIAGILGLVVFTLATAPTAPLMTTLLPRVAFALVWLYAGLAIVATVYFVPVDSLHRVVLTGFATFLFVYGVTWAVTADDARQTGVVNAVAFDLLMMVLAHAAWRRDDLSGASPQRVAAFFWPWRRRIRPRPAVNLRPTWAVHPPLA